MLSADFETCLCHSYHESLKVPFVSMDCQCSKLNRGVCWAGEHLYSIKSAKIHNDGGFSADKGISSEHDDGKTSMMPRI